MVSLVIYFINKIEIFVLQNFNKIFSIESTRTNQLQIFGIYIQYMRGIQDQSLNSENQVRLLIFSFSLSQGSLEIAISKTFQQFGDIDQIITQLLRRFLTSAKSIQGNQDEKSKSPVGLINACDDQISRMNIQHYNLIVSEYGNEFERFKK
ncbi:hypothetical protein pb186bvf_008595 [Paramecium bursaria]